MPTPVTAPSSQYSVAQAAAGLDFSASPVLPKAVAITGGGTIDFVDANGGVTTGAVLDAGRPYPWTIKQITGCTGSGEVQFFFDLSALQALYAWDAADIVVLKADVAALEVDSAPPGAPSASQIQIIGSAALAIDPVNGSANGPTYQTAAQFAQAVGAGTLNELNIAMTLTVLGDLGASDPLVRPRVGASGTLVVTGSAGATTLHSGTFTAVAAPNSAAGTNEGQTITDTALSGNWDVAGPGGTSLLGKRIRISSGARAGTVLWALENIATKKARCTTPILDSLVLPIASAATLSTPHVSDPYVVESLPTITIADPHADVSASLGPSVDTYFRTIFEGIRLPGVGTNPIGLPWIGRSGQAGALFIACDLGTLGGFYRTHGCYADNIYMYPGDHIAFCASGVLASFDTELLVRGVLQVDQGTIFQGMVVKATNAGYIDWIDGAVFDSASYGIHVTSGSSAVVSGPCYGKGNATRGAHVADPGASIGLASVVPTITGTSGEVSVGATGSTWATVAGTTLTVSNSSVGTVA